MAVLSATLTVWPAVRGSAQEALPPTPIPSAGASPPTADPPPMPDGVEVLARGPVHEAFAAPVTEPAATTPVGKPPPKPLDEMPPAEKPAGAASWIPGYWSWDDERKDYLWVSGAWRTPPPGRSWVAGYWKEEAGQWRWVAGLWAAADLLAPGGTHQITYQPAPPAPPATPPPGQPLTADSFFVPGHWVWHEAGYVAVNGAPAYRDAGYAWSAGYWAHVQPGHVWVPAHYRWTPSGYVFVGGYWDLALPQRGFLYAPVYVTAGALGPGFVYTPVYAVPHTALVDALWVRPSHCHYYFGDYYGAAYARYGFENAVVYSRRCYDPIIVYAAYEHRAEPRWASQQIDICLGRAAGRLACPPRTLVEQVRVGYAGPGVVAAVHIGAVSGVAAVHVEARERLEAVRHAEAVRHLAAERSLHEVRLDGAELRAPHTAAYHLPGHSAGAHAAPVPPPRRVLPPRKGEPEKRHGDPHERP
jgi:hypothetical protein